jgi:hypothetical protein
MFLRFMLNYVTFERKRGRTGLTGLEVEFLWFAGLLWFVESKFLLIPFICCRI